MRNIKKGIVLFLTLVMMSMSLTVLADETTEHIITIENETTGHVYEAYQVFVGRLTDGKLANIEWGSGVDGTELLNELKLTEVYADCTSAEMVAEVLSGFENDSTELEAFAKTVAKHLSASKTTSAESASPYTMKVTGDGYYFVKDKDDSLDGIYGDSYTKHILTVIDDETITAKDGTVTAQKKVDDKNDSNTSENAADWQDSADYDIGDAVPFRIQITLPSNFTDYETYPLTIHDTESEGLTFNNNVVVLIGGKTVSTDFYDVKTEGVSDGCTFEIHFDDLRETAAGNNSVITVEYNSTLNEDAVLGSLGNPNTMYVTYCNNPNAGGGSGDEGDNGNEDGRTVSDTVIVFTYKTIINKVEEDGTTPLPGAKFTLEKWNETGKAWKDIKTVDILTETTTTFEFCGLDDGFYRLVETEAPEGYNSIDPIYFEVKAVHGIDTDSLTLNSLSATQKGEDGSDLQDGIIAAFTAELSSGKIESDIVNKAGTVLPATGGMGTTVFYVMGAILVMGALVLLITKKRMNHE